MRRRRVGRRCPRSRRRDDGARECDRSEETELHLTLYLQGLNAQSIPLKSRGVSPPPRDVKARSASKTRTPSRDQGAHACAKALFTPKNFLKKHKKILAFFLFVCYTIGRENLNRIFRRRVTRLSVKRRLHFLERGSHGLDEAKDTEALSYRRPLM